MDIKRTELSPGVHFTRLPGDAYKRCSVTLQLSLPAKREDATALALLSLVMERGYADCPDMTALSKKLAQLYGAGLDVSTRMNGALRTFTVSVRGIRDEYALNGENLSAEYARLAAGVLLRPYLVDGVFSAEAVDIEKEQLRQELQSEINDKRLYCLRQARRKFYGDNPAGVESNGYLSDLDALTGADLLRVYREMLRTAEIEIFSMGAGEDTVRSALSEALQTVQRESTPHSSMVHMPAVAEQSFTEDMDTEQGKLCLLYTGGATPPEEQMPAYRTAVAMFGGTATSRLFMNVREKMSLCYYCSAGYVYNSSAMVINCGVEHKNAAKAKAAIIEQLALLRDNEIPEAELEDAKRALVNSYLSIANSAGGLLSWYAAQIDRGTLRSPEEEAQRIQAVTAQQVKDALAAFSLSVSYCIAKKEDAAHA